MAIAFGALMPSWLGKLLSAGRPRATSRRRSRCRPGDQVSTALENEAIATGSFRPQIRASSTPGATELIRTPSGWARGGDYLPAYPVEAEIAIRQCRLHCSSAVVHARDRRLLRPPPVAAARSLANDDLPPIGHLDHGVVKQSTTQPTDGTSPEAFARWVKAQEPKTVNISRCSARIFQPGRSAGSACAFQPQVSCAQPADERREGLVVEVAEMSLSPAPR